MSLSLRSLLVTLTLLFFTACGGGGGDSTSSTDTTPSTTSPGVHAAVLKSVPLGSESHADDLINTQCGSAGGIAIYTGIDSNENGVLDTDERTGEPQIVCNGSSNTPDYSVTEIASGDSTCPYGGIKLTTSTNSYILCNQAITNSMSDFTQTGTIIGKLDITNANPAPSRVAQSSAVSGKKLKLVSGNISSLINEDKNQTNTGKTSVPKPITKPIDVILDANDSYKIPDLPSGDYSLIYVDEDTKEGKKVDDIYVEPGKTTIKDIIDLTHTGEVKLKVTSLRTNTALSNATVYLNELDINTTTDTNGTAAFDNLPKGHYSLAIAANGYVPKYVTFNVLSSKTTDLKTINLNDKKGKLVGKVEATGVEDYSNIIVYAKGADGSLYTTLSSSNGYYTFNTLPVGEGYSLLAYAHDYAANKVDNITIREGATTSANTITLDRLQAIGGTITGFAHFADINGSLDHAGIIVSIEGSDQEAITARDGSFIINNIPLGTYTLNISDSNHLTVSQQNVKILEGATTTLTNISLSAKVGNLKGKVVDESGNGVTNANVVLTTNSHTYSTVTDTNGLYTFNGVVVGDYTISVSKDGYGVVTSTANIAPQQTTDTTASPLQTVRKILTGKLNLQNSTDNAGATVALVGSDVASVVSDTNGSFTLYGVGAGNYQLQITKAGYVTKNIPLTVSSDNGYAIPYTVEVEIAKGIINGVATLNEKVDHSGIQVRLLDTNTTTYTDSSGKWAMNVPIGNYANGVEFSKNLFSKQTLNNTITVVENGSYTTSSVALQQISQNLKGVITVDGKSDYSDAIFAISGTDGAAQGTTADLTAAANGEFTLSNLPLGTYTYTVSYPDELHESIINSFTLDGSKEALDLGTIDLRTSYVQINNNAIYTNDKNVTLTIGNSNATYMQISEGGNTLAKEGIKSSKNIILSDGDGLKTVTVKLFDGSDNPLPSVTDGILLDTTLNVTSFTLSGATKKGDVLHIALDLGESDATAFVNIPNIVNNLKLLDNATGGDTTANDGVYERNILITTPQELNLVATATITDIAKNETTATSNTLAISTNPSIENVIVRSNVKDATMNISFTTDEPATSKIYYGADTSYGSEANISTNLATNHSITLNNLTPNALTYFKIEVSDAANNSSSFASQSKLAPPAPTNFAVAPGDNEVGLVWDKVDTQGVVGYNLYRSDSDNAFIKVNDTLITDTYFVDSFAYNDVTYSYKLTAVDDNDNESEPTAPLDVTPNASLAGPTDINGSIIDTNTIWLSSRSPYNITGNVKVKSGNTLLWLPGVNVNILDKNNYFLVEGLLSALGNTQNYVDITGYRILTANNGVVNLKYSNIHNIDRASSYTDSASYNINVYDSNISIIPINSGQGQATLAFNKIDKSNITFKEDNLDYCDCNTVYIHALHRSIIKNTNSRKLSLKFNNIYKSDVNGEFYIYLEESIDESNFNNVDITADGANIQHSTFKDSKINQVNTVQYNILNNTTVSSGHKFNYNYWGTTDLNEIIKKTNYLPNKGSTLFPIITSDDLMTADFDQDGIADYMDNDNDNDGYSDLQEDKESDPDFNVLYNPLDAASHPSSAKDNDIDGTPDDSDDDDDNDGLTDTEEANYQTNPMIADSDGDGINDGVEISDKYDPTDKNNYPISSNQSEITIDNSNVNSDGVVYIKGETTDWTNERYIVILTNISIATGTKITIDKDTQVQIKDSNIVGSKTNPIIFRSNGAGNGSLWLSNTNMSYTNIKLALDFSATSNSTVKYSDLSFKNDGSFLSDSTSSISNSYINSTNYWRTDSGTFLKCYITGGYISFSSSYMSNSYVTLSNYNTLYLQQDSRIFDSYIKATMSDSTNKAPIIENSIVDEIYNNENPLRIKNSDTTLQSSNVALVRFYDNTYFGYFGLGSPEDQIGDGVAETKFTIDSTEYTVDGITNPRNTKNFPNWVNDPSVKQYFWDPTNVGCLWDSSNPDTFPTP